ncbi:MAG: outer membrane lipoprotein carrier protein LolA [Acidobacteriota bacterium]
MSPILCAAVLALSWLAPATRQKLPSPEPVLKRMAQAYESLASLRANLTQVKSYPQLRLTDPPEKGTLYVKRKGKDGARVRLEIHEPEKRIVTVNEGRYVLYQPKIKQAIEGNVNPKSASGGTSFVSYFLGDLSQAKEDYAIASLGDEPVDGRQTVHLRLTAKPKGKGFYRQIDLWVDNDLGVPVQQEFVEPNRAVVRIRFGDIQTDIAIKDSFFNLKLPPDVERIRG